MSTSHSSIADQALEVVDGITGLLDVAFAHDLAVTFADLGTHDTAATVVGSLRCLLSSVREEVERVETLGELGALIGTLEPGTDALYELLLEGARVFHRRAVLAVMTTRLPMELALSHLRAVARFGARTPIELEQRTALHVVLDALIGNMRSFGELLQILDPIEPEPEPGPGAAASLSK